MFLQTSSFSTDEAAPSPTLTSHPSPSTSPILGNGSINATLSPRPPTETRKRVIVAHLDLPPLNSPGNKFFGPRSARVMQYTPTTYRQQELNTPLHTSVLGQEVEWTSLPQNHDRANAPVSPSPRPLRDALRRSASRSRARQGSRNARRRSRSFFLSGSEGQSNEGGSGGNVSLCTSLEEGEEGVEGGKFEETPWGLGDGEGEAPAWERSEEDEKGSDRGDLFRKVQKAIETAWGRSLGSAAVQG